MDRNSLIRKLEAELGQARKNFKEGKGIPLEKFDWDMPPQIAESKTAYHVQQEA